MSKETQLPRRSDPFNQSSILGNPRQRLIFSILLEHTQPLTDRDLAVKIAARETDTSPSDMTGNDYQSILVDLHHRCLPKLEAVGYVERHAEGIIAAEPPSFGEGDLSLPPLDAPDVRWEQLTAILSRPHRKDVLSVLAREDRPLTLEELSVKLAAHDPFCRTIDKDEKNLSIILHHVDLPALEEAGLLRYDPDEEMITRDPALTTIVD